MSIAAAVWLTERTTIGSLVCLKPPTRGQSANPPRVIMVPRRAPSPRPFPGLLFPSCASSAGFAVVGGRAGSRPGKCLISAEQCWIDGDAWDGAGVRLEDRGSSNGK